MPKHPPFPLIDTVRRAALLLVLAAQPGLVAQAQAQAPAGCAMTGSTVDMETCLSARLKDANDRLNAVYGETMQALPAARQARLRRDERAWIRRRDATCRVGRGQGTAGPLKAGQCQLDQTIARTTLLRNYR